MRTGVVTDSSCDLPAHFFDRRDVICVPLDVRLGTKDPKELRDLAPHEFWRLVRDSGELPTTAAPSPGAFLNAYEELERRGYEAVIVVTISAKLSATYQAAAAAASECSLPVSVIDSENATTGEGLLVLDAIDLARRDLDVKEVVFWLEKNKHRIRTIGALDTLEYLRRGGRIGGAQAFFGALLSIKPIIEVRHGKVEGVSRERTRRRSLQHLADNVLDSGPLRRIAVVHAHADDVDEFVAMLDEVVTEEPLFVSEMGPVVGAHTGLGTVGVTFVPALPATK